MTMKGIKRRNIVIGLRVSLSISIIVSLVLLARTMDLEQLNLMREIRPFYLLLAVGLMLLMWLVQGIRMQILASALDEHISLHNGIKNYLAGAFVSNVTPFASGGGPVQVFLLNQMGISLGKASSIIIVQWVFRHVFFGLLGPIFFIFYRNLIDPGQLPAGVFQSAVIGSISITIVLLFFVWKPQVIPMVANGVLRLPLIRDFLAKREKLKTSLDNLIDTSFHEIEVFHECIWRLAGEKRMELILGVVFTGLFWTFFFMIAPVILIGLGSQPHFAQAFIMQTIMFLILPYIPTPGASGVAELAFAAFFSPFVPIHLLGILAIAWRLLTFYMMIIFGSMTVLRELSKQ